jgi:hypothetical protein
LAARYIALALAVASLLIVRQALQSRRCFALTKDSDLTLAPAAAAPPNIRPSAPAYMASGGATGVTLADCGVGRCCHRAGSSASTLCVATDKPPAWSEP